MRTHHHLCRPEAFHGGRHIQPIALHHQASALVEALAQIGGVVNSSLEPDEVLRIVMDNIVRLTKAERGFLYGDAVLG